MKTGLKSVTGIEIEGLNGKSGCAYQIRNIVTRLRGINKRHERCPRERFQSINENLYAGTGGSINLADTRYCSLSFFNIDRSTITGSAATVNPPRAD